MICKQWCSRDCLEPAVTSPCPQVTDPQFRLSQHRAVPGFAALQWGSLCMVILQHLSPLKHHEGLLRSKALQLGEVLFRQP